MRITVATIDDAADVLTLEIAADLSIQDLKAVIESESNFGITAVDMILMHDGSSIDNFNFLIFRMRFFSDVPFSY